MTKALLCLVGKKITCWFLIHKSYLNALQHHLLYNENGRNAQNHKNQTLNDAEDDSEYEQQHHLLMIETDRLDDSRLI